MKTTSFQTSRLNCLPLTVGNYSDFEAGKEPTWEGFSNPYKHLVEGPSPLPHRIPRIKTDPAFAEIGIILAIERERQEIIGSAGFHDFPDENGMIEIGFGIVPEMQNQGFGQELLLGMWNMISTHQDLKRLRYTVSPTNQPSLHIIKKLGFLQVGEQMDPEDGLEIIFENSVKDFLAKHLTRGRSSKELSS